MIQEASENKVKICEGFSFFKRSSFLSYILPVLGFLIFGDLRVQFLINCFSYKNVFSSLPGTKVLQ